MKRPVALYMLFIVLSIFIFFLLNLLLGSVHIPFKDVWHILWGDYDGNVIWQNIVWKSRIPQALTALVAGAGLSVSGLQMQTVFRNPLAGPSVLGISSGASMGVAFVVLLSGTIGGVGDFTLMGEGKLRMTYIPQDAQLISGDQVTTSGLGGKYPGGLLVGQVESIETEADGISRSAVLRPSADVENIRYVYVITNFEG